MTNQEVKTMNNAETKNLTNVTDLKVHDEFISYLSNLGGTFSLEEAAFKLDMTPEQLKQEISQDKLISVLINGEEKIPAFQVKNFKKLNHLEDVLLLLTNMDPREKIIFLAEPAKYLKGKSPIQIFTKYDTPKNIEKIKKAANVEVEAHSYVQEGKPSNLKGIKDWAKNLRSRQSLPMPISSHLIKLS